MTVPQSKPKVYLSVDEVAAILGIPKSTIYNWSYKNYGPPRVKVGNALRFPSDELFDWLESQTIRPEEDKS